MPECPFGAFLMGKEPAVGDEEVLPVFHQQLCITHLHTPPSSPDVLHLNGNVPLDHLHGVSGRGGTIVQLPYGRWHSWAVLHRTWVHKGELGKLEEHVLQTKHSDAQALLRLPVRLEGTHCITFRAFE